MGKGWKGDRERKEREGEVSERGDKRGERETREGKGSTETGRVRARKEL